MVKLTKVTGEIVKILAQDMEIQRETWQETKINHTGFGNYVAKTDNKQESDAIYMLRSLAINRLLGVCCDELSIALPNGEIKNLENILIPNNIVKYIRPGENVTIVYSGGDENKEREPTQAEKMMLNIKKQSFSQVTNVKIERGILGLVSKDIPNGIISSLILNSRRIDILKLLFFTVIGIFLSIFLIGFLFLFVAYTQFKSIKNATAVINMAKEMMHSP